MWDTGARIGMLPDAIRMHWDRLGCIGIAAGGSEYIGIQAPALGIPPDKSYLSGGIVS